MIRITVAGMAVIVAIGALAACSNKALKGSPSVSDVR